MFGVALFASASASAKPAGVPSRKDPGPSRYDEISRLATIAEERTQIWGLRDYLMATAWTESKGKLSAVNFRDGPAALSLFCSKYNYNVRYLRNPFRPVPCKGSELSGLWKYSGGWFGLMPASALATEDGAAVLMDPRTIFDPVLSVAYATDMVVRLYKKYGARNWDGVRAGWKKPSWSRRGIQHEKEKGTRKRFRRAIKAMRKYGVPTNLPHKKVDISHYPGYRAVLASLRNEQKAIEAEAEAATEES